MPSGGRGAVAPALGEHEGARAERDLRGPGLPAAQPEQRRLLVARRGGDPDPVGRLGLDPVRVHDRRQQVARDAEQLEQLVVPLRPAQRAEQRAARIAGVAHVHAGEPVEQPRRDVAVGEVAVLSLVEQPAQLRRRERGVQLEPGALADQRRVLAQPGAHGVGAAVLPDDRGMDRAPGLAVPDDERLRLVGDAERRDVGRPHTRPRDRLDRRPHERLRVLLDEPRPRERALHGHRRRAPLAQVGVDRDAARARRALVEAEDERRHALTARRSASAAR